MRRSRAPAAALAAVLALAGCATDRATRPAALDAAEARAAVAQLLPAALADRNGWAADVVAALAALDVPATPAHLCAVLAVTEQESSFSADPPVPNLGSIARREIDRRAEAAGVPALAVRAALALASSDGRSYAERIDGVRTERELSELYEEFIDRIPLGQRLLASRNPVRTGGPMQVSIAFAEAQVEVRRYPYAARGSIRHEVFTRRGGLYFGAAHLLAYAAPYDADAAVATEAGAPAGRSGATGATAADGMLFRFADFNAGRWASRNAAFQRALSVATGTSLVLDGDLLPSDPSQQGTTERAAQSLAPRLGLEPAAIRADLARGEGAGFERTALYRKVFALAERAGGHALPRAVVPRITLQSPKITRTLTTQWFAERVDARHQRCLARYRGLAAAREG